MRISAEMPDTGRVYILILNWNGWKDTIECLESVFRSDYRDYRVIVCDNGSSDGSLDYIRAWAQGDLDLALARDHPLRALCFPPVPKPIPYVEYDHREAEEGGGRADAGFRLILVRNGANLGYAAGNNVGLRYALARGDFEYVWLLNNDTVVDPSALGHLVGVHKLSPGLGAVGSVLLRYDDPGKIQMAGGTIIGPIGFPKQDLKGRMLSNLRGQPQTIHRDFLSGASLLTSRQVLEEIGLLPEEYFMYWEDADWCATVKTKLGLNIACVLTSRVWHKEGASVGYKSNLQQELDMRGTLLFSSRFHASYLPLVMTCKPVINVLSALKRGKGVIRSISSDLKGLSGFLHRKGSRTRIPWA